MKKINNDYDEPEFDDVLAKSEDDLFEIGQSYEETPVKKILCKKCGSDKWFVGKGSYYTAIKCPECLYEICIHNG